MKFIYLSLILFLFITTVDAQQKIVGVNGLVNPYQYNISKNCNYKKAAVATAHPLASLCGAAIMKQGGNAFDAAVTTQLVLAVVYPGAGNIGGGGFMIAKTPKKTLCLDFRETAPNAATENMYLDDKGNVLPSLAQDAHLAVAVPGTVAGIFELLPYCKLSFKTLIQPAIDIAKNGFCITNSEAESLNDEQKSFISCNTKMPVFVSNKLWKVGDTLVQKDLANTLTLIKNKGKAGFYEGETAQLIVNEMQRGKGIITLNDLKNYKAIWRKPLQFNYKNYSVISMPPPSSGGAILCQLLTMINSRNIAVKGFQTLASVQLMIEAERRAFADRATHYGDPSFYKVPLKTLMSKKYIENRMSDYDSTKPSASNTIVAGKIESEETTHISIADNEGNLVTITTTLNGHYGSKTVVAGAGFILNNQMDDFSIKPGVANMYGAIGAKANAIAANKRMLSSMTPTIVLKNNKSFMVLGTPGGTTIPTSVFQTIVNVIDFKMNAVDAVNKPKFHHQWQPDEVFIEEGFNTNTAQQLQQMGYKVKTRSPIGRVELIHFNNNVMTTVADSRGDDSVAGW